jgi:uncharacterized protein YciI
MHFFAKLNPPRPSFANDMTDEEKAFMHEHVAYWMDKQAKGHVIVFGPVFDPKGVYGVGVLQVDSEEALSEFTQNDPALKAGNTYETYPMKAVTKS